MIPENKRSKKRKKGEIKNPEHGEPARTDAPKDPPQQLKAKPGDVPRPPPGDYPSEPERDEEEGLDEVDTKIEKNAGAESADDAEESETEENEQADERHPQEPQPHHP